LQEDIYRVMLAFPSDKQFPTEQYYGFDITGLKNE